MDIIYKPIKYNYTKASMKPKYIVIHDTGNTSAGADAEAHYRYFNGANRGASAHYFVDDHSVIRVIDENNQAWHCGKKYTSSQNVPSCNNSNSIGIEICINSDGNLDKAIENAIWLIKDVSTRHNIPIENIITHKDCTGKNCPSTLIKLDKLKIIYDALSKKDTDNKITWKEQSLIDAGLDIDYWKDKNVVDLSVGEFTALITKIIKAVK